MRAEPRQDLGSAPGSETPTPLSRAVEALDWLEDYHADMFNVCQLALDVIALTGNVGRSASEVTLKDSGGGR